MTAHLDPIDDIVHRHSVEPSTIAATVRSSIDAIEQNNAATNAVIWQDQNFIEKQIARLGTSVKRSAIDNKNDGEGIAREFPLLGIPVLLKELDSCVEGTPNSWGNVALKESTYRDNFTSSSVQCLIDAGAIIVGKTNNPELGLTVTTNSIAHGPVNNPLHSERNAGGSSGGSAAAVASGMVSIATASDGGGSARMPAALCGVYGFKPTRGRISQGPIVSEGWAGIATKGIIANNVENISRTLDVQSQYFSGDSYSAHPRVFDSFSQLDRCPQGLRIGVRTRGFADMYEVDPALVDATNKMCHFLTSRGHIVHEASPSTYDDAFIIDSFMKIIACNTVADIAEIERRLGRQLDISTCNGETQYFYEEGKKVLAHDYILAKYLAEIFGQHTARWYDNFDVLITPTTASVAPLHGEVEADPMNKPFHYSGLCFPSNIAGTPAITIPVKSDHETGLPAAIQIATARDNDLLALQLARFIESDYSDIFVTPGQNITS